MAVTKEYKIKQVIRVLITPEGSFLGAYDLHRELGIKEDFTPWIKQMFNTCNIHKQDRPFLFRDSILYEYRNEPDYKITFDTARLIIAKCTANEENKRSILKCFQENESIYIKRFQYPQRTITNPESTELIHITEKNGERAVSARSLHEFLEVKTRFDKWIQRMFEYGFIENEDYQAVGQKRPTAQGNQTAFIDYALCIDCAKEISMLQRTQKGKQARKYFIEIEKKYNLRAEPEIGKFTLKEFSLVNPFCGVFYHKAGAVLKLNFTTSDVALKTLILPIVSICGGIEYMPCGYLFREPEGAITAQRKLTVLCYSFEIPLLSMNTICEFGLKEAGMLETYKKFYNT